MEPNLVELLNCRKKDTLLQTAVIADQNGDKIVGKTNCGNEELLFLQMRSRRVEQVKKGAPDAFSIKFGCLLLLLIPNETSQFLFQFVPVIGFFKICFFFLTIGTNWTRDCDVPLGISNNRRQTKFENRLRLTNANCIWSRLLLVLPSHPSLHTDPTFSPHLGQQ